MPPLIINRDNYNDAIRDRLYRTPPDDSGSTVGCFPTQLAARTEGVCTPADDYIDPIPRSEWTKLIRRLGSYDLHALAADELPPHDQGETNYCWAHAAVRAVEYAALYETDEEVAISAESVAVPITGGRNRGGWPEEALKRLISHGACHQDFWPKNARDPKLWTPEVAENAATRRVIRWLSVNSWEMQITLALHRIPVCLVIPWWAHAVCQVNAVILPDGEVGIGCDNSWGADYGDNGYFLMTEDRGSTGEGAFAPLTINWTRRQDHPYLCPPEHGRML